MSFGTDTQAEATQQDAQSLSPSPSPMGDPLDAPSPMGDSLDGAYADTLHYSDQEEGSPTHA